jgi:hypothetical protein
MVLTASIGAAAWVLAQTVEFDPHGDPDHGVLRVVTDPQTRGQCIQCHPSHGEAGPPDPKVLFTANDNGLCFATDGTSPCHAARPSNYPLDEQDRIPVGEPDAGYFEFNSGGVRTPGVDLRGRWPGEPIYTDPRTLPSGRWVSAHAHDPDMPRRDASGDGLWPRSAFDTGARSPRRDVRADQRPR